MKGIITDKELRELKKLAVAYHTMQNKFLKRIYRRLDSLPQTEVTEFADELEDKKYTVTVTPWGNYGEHRVRIFGAVAFEASRRRRAFERSKKEGDTSETASDLPD